LCADQVKISQVVENYLCAGAVFVFFAGLLILGRNPKWDEGGGAFHVEHLNAYERSACSFHPAVPRGTMCAIKNPCRLATELFSLSCSSGNAELAPVAMSLTAAFVYHGLRSDDDQSASYQSVQTPPPRNTERSPSA
jgi:hypothetical protein